MTAPLFGVYSQHGDHLGGLTADHAEAMRWAQQRADRTGREVCVGREDGTGDVDWVEPTPHCESGAWSQVRCDGPRETRTTGKAVRCMVGRLSPPCRHSSYSRACCSGRVGCARNGSARKEQARRCSRRHESIRLLLPRRA